MLLWIHYLIFLTKHLVSIAPWKQNLAYHLFKETKNDTYKTFQTSCGTIKGRNFKNDVNSLIKNNEFRIKGKG